MFKTMNPYFFLIPALILSLTGCSGFFDKDNTPTPSALTAYTPEVQPVLMWTTNTGSGSKNEYLKLTPAISQNAIFTSDHQGRVTAVRKSNGDLLWHTQTGLTLTSGPGANDEIVVVGSRKGEVVALHAQDGQVWWHHSVAGEILANPAVANGKVIIKTIDGAIRAFSYSGEKLWTYQQTEPSLLLRGSSTPPGQKA